MRTPSQLPEPPPQPRGGTMWCVAYVDSRGRTCTTLHRQRAAALRLAHRVEQAGGTPVLYAADLAPADWRQVNPPGWWRA